MPMVTRMWQFQDSTQVCLTPEPMRCIGFLAKVSLVAVRSLSLAVQTFVGPDSAGLSVPRAKRSKGDVYRLEETESPKI